MRRLAWLWPGFLVVLLSVTDAAASNCTAVSGEWDVSIALTCTNTNITASFVNVTETGSLTLRNVTLRSGNVYVTGPGGGGGGGRLSYENTTFDGSQAWWLNGNLTIGGHVNLSGVKLYLNGTADGSAGINVTNTGALWINGNATNLTAGETVANGYFFWVDSGSNLSVQDTAIYYSGYSATRYGRGLTINTTAVNMTRVKIYDASYVGLTILEGANGTNYTSIDIQRASDSAVTIRSAKSLNLSIFNASASAGGISLISDGLTLEHGNISDNIGDGLGGNGVQNLTLIDLNFSNGFQSALGLVNLNRSIFVGLHIIDHPWYAWAGYALENVVMTEVNASGQTAGSFAINYDQLGVKDGERSNQIFLGNATLAGTTDFRLAGHVNVTAWNTTIDSVVFDSCACNLTVQWPFEVLVQNATTNASLNNARVQTLSADGTQNHTNYTGLGGVVRYLNMTEYKLDSAAYFWVGNHTIRGSKTGFVNVSLSLNVSGPNSTTLRLNLATPNISRRLDPNTSLNTSQELTGYAVSWFPEDAVTFFFSWTVNGTPHATGHVGGTAGTERNVSAIIHTFAAGGDTWVYEVFARNNNTNLNSTITNLTIVIPHLWAAIDNVSLPATNSTQNITCFYKYNDSDNHTQGDTRIVWYVNGSATSNVSASNNQSNLSETNYVKNQVVNCSVFGYNGFNYTPLVSATLTINNSAPNASGATVAPDSGRASETFVCALVLAEDPDNDGVTGHFQFLDTDNASILQNFSTNASFDCAQSENCTAGDTINCWALGNDGAANSSIYVMNFTIAASASPGGGGGGTQRELEPIITYLPGANETVYVNVTRPYCGDNICQDDEAATTCWRDCKVNIDTLIVCIWKKDQPCNWRQQWFATTAIGLIVIITVGAFYLYEFR